MRRAFSGIGAKKRQVSIHASVKDATSPIQKRLLLIGVSIHASVKDATLDIEKSKGGSVFQSTHL